ncbi:MAG: PD-(D/E)XK nuclease family protein [Solirubrobacteraceae bacterium]|nr:PD-(D/E)XK nuclease family protein [Solirubrobacteraceae bacterium]
MPLHLLLGPAGARKTGRLLDAHQAAARAGGEAWLVVPSGADLVPIRRELLGVSAPGGVPRTPTPYADLLGAHELERRLVKRLGGPAALSQDQRRAVTQAVIAEAMRDERLEALLPGARRGWLCDELITLADELTVTLDFGEDALRALRSWGGSAGGRRGIELAELLAADAARRTALAAGGGPVARGVGARAVIDALDAGTLDVSGLHLTLAGFDDLDPVQRHLVTALGRSEATVLLSLPFAPGREALVAAGPLVDSLRAAGGEAEIVAFDPALVDVDPRLASLSGSLFEALPETAVITPEAVAGSPHTSAVVELEGAGPDEELALISQLVAEELASGTDPAAMAVLTASPDLHGPAVVAALSRRGVPAHLAGRRSAAATPIVRGAISLIRAAAAYQARGAGGEAADIVRWAAVIDPARAELLDAQVRRRDARTVRDALRLWQRVTGGERLTALDRLLSPSGRPGSLERAIAAVLGDAALAWAMREGGRPDPGTERAVRAAREAAKAMDLRGAFVERAWAMTPRVALAAGLDDLRRALEELRLGAEPEPAGSIAVLGPLAIRTRTVEVLVIARAQRGTFPAAESSRRALGRADRAVLHADHQWPQSTEPAHGDGERYLAYEIATTPTRRLAIGWHAGDGDGGAGEPSPLVAELRRVAGASLERRSLEAGAAAIAGAATATRARLEAAVAGVRHREVQHQRSEELAGTQPTHHGVGALQTASRCTAQWFVDQHLRPRPLDPDAAQLKAGLMRHDLLAKLLRSALEQSIELGPDALPALEAGLDAAARQQAATGAQNNETLAERLLRERVIAEIEATLPALCGTEPLAHQPSELELAFGTSRRSADDDGEAPDARAPVVVRRNEHELTLSGRIDRLDVSNDGKEVVVVDYKGANVEPYRGRGWVERRELQAGLYALVAEELTGARAVGSLYQAVPGPPDQPPRGATVERLGERGMRHGSNDVVGEDEWSELLDELVRLAAEAAAAIDDGCIAPRPVSCSDDGCRHPWLCREQRG